MKLVALTCTLAIVFSANAFTVDDRIAQVSEAVPAPEKMPVNPLDRILGDSISNYDNEGEAAKADFWYAAICSSDFVYKYRSLLLRKQNPDRASIVDSVRASMQKKLSLAHQGTQAAADQVWQDWHAIPDSEKKMTNNEGHTNFSDGFFYANDLATDCFLAKSMVDKNYHNCNVKGVSIALDSLNSVCFEVSPQSRIRKLQLP